MAGVRITQFNGIIPRAAPKLLPENAALMSWVEEKAREVFRVFGYEEIRTPLLEETEVFTRSIGEDTDIVERRCIPFPTGGVRMSPCGLRGRLP